jgi:hypothetical protein
MHQEAGRRNQEAGRKEREQIMKCEICGCEITQIQAAFGGGACKECAKERDNKKFDIMQLFNLWGKIPEAEQAERDIVAQMRKEKGNE